MLGMNRSDLKPVQGATGLHGIAEEMGKLAHLARAAWRGLVALWLALGTVVLVLAAIELVPETHTAWKRLLRLLDPLGGKADFRAGADAYGGADWTREYWVEYSARSRVDWAPYVLWRSLPATGRHFNVDAAGHRVTHTAPPPPGVRPVRIFLFGGSAMFGMGARDAHTIASELARKLAAVAPVEVTNFGQPGWVMAQSAAEFQEQLKAGNIPDIAVFYDGSNDLFSVFSQGRVGLPQNNDNRVREFNLTGEDRRGALVRETILGLLHRSLDLARWVARTPQAGIPVQEQDNIFRLARQSADYMAATMVQVWAVAAAHGVEAHLFSQPTAFTKRRRTPFEEAAATGYGPLEVAYGPAMRALAEHPRIAGRAEFHALADIFDDRPEPYYLDHVHVGENGNAAIAARMAEDLRSAVLRRLKPGDALELGRRMIPAP